MRRAAFAIALTACASSTAGAPTPSTATNPAAIYTGPERSTIYADPILAATAPLKASPAAAWDAVKKVYAAFEVPIAFENTATHELGNKDFYKTRQFGGKPMADLVNCGSGITGQNASSWRIYMSLVTTVSPAGGGGSVVRTVFTTSGRDMAGMSADKIVCTSTGQFEKLLTDRVKTTVGG